MIKRRLTRHFKNLLSFAEIKSCRNLRGAPKHIFFPVAWLTNRCNLRCLMCDQWKTESRAATLELSTKEWHSFIDSASRMQALIMVITGGEPLLRNDIFEIIGHVREKGMACHLCSNGTLLNETAVKKLRSNGLNSISVSLDSDVAEIHNHLRGADCFDAVIRGIKILKTFAPEVKLGINCVISKQNFRNLHRLVPFAESLGARQVKFDIIHTNLMHKNKSPESFNELMFLKDDLPELEEEINKLKDVLRRSRILTSPRIFLEGILKFCNGKPYKLPCYAGYASCAVSAYGKISPCEEFEGVDGLKKDRFENIWKSRSFGELRKKVKNCNCACWDTTHAEINLRCHGFGFIKEAPQILKEMRFYG